MINPDAATTISDATRTSLDDLDHLPDNAHVRAVIVLLDVETDDGSTQVLWNTSPPISTAWTHGLLNTAAHLTRQGYADTND